MVAVAGLVAAVVVAITKRIMIERFCSLTCLLASNWNIVYQTPGAEKHNAGGRGEKRSSPWMLRVLEFEYNYCYSNTIFISIGSVSKSPEKISGQKDSDDTTSSSG